MVTYSIFYSLLRAAGVDTVYCTVVAPPGQKKRRDSTMAEKDKKIVIPEDEAQKRDSIDSVAGLSPRQSKKPRPNDHKGT